MAAKRISAFCLLSLVLFFSSTSQADTGKQSAMTSAVAKIWGYVQAIVSDGDGGLYVGGSAVLVHINADGSRDRTWKPQTPDNGRILTLARSGNRLYVGGYFTRYSGRRRDGLAAVDIKTGELIAWKPRLRTSNWDPSVNSLVAAGGKVYVGGHFRRFGDRARQDLAAIDGQGNLTAWSPRAKGEVFGLAVAGGRVYIGGDFDLVNGRSRHNLAAVDSESGRLLKWGSSVTSSDPAGLTYRRHNLDVFDRGTTLLRWGSPVTHEDRVVVITITTTKRRVYVGGHFSLVGDQERLGIAALDRKTGSVIKDWHPNLHNMLDSTSNYASGIQVYQGKVYFGGNFSRVGKKRRSSLAAVEAGSGKLTSWAPSAGDWINAFFRSGRRIYVGARFGYNFSAVDARTGAVLP